ncbi:MAG: hypothetical protein UDG86_01410 [Lachnospiraceae bacterium]|jgi:hypothetical protein|nr:hypothetical protein [Lachnospiraceae bacterium]
MRGKHKAIYAVLCIILISTFLPFWLPLERAADTERIHRVYEESSQQGDVIHMESDHINAADFIQPEQKNTAVRMRQLKERTLKNLVLILTVLSISSFSLWISLKRAFFAYLQSYLYPMARFLCDIITRQKKDGKKRCRHFCNC